LISSPTQASPQEWKINSSFKVLMCKSLCS
jgi:hypothetical protein